MNPAIFRTLFWPFAMAVGLECVALVSTDMSSGFFAPSFYSTWFRSRGAPHLGTFLWDLMVVGALGLGLPAFIAALAAFLLGGPAVLNVLTFVVVALLCMLVFLPWLHEGARWSRAVASLTRPWWRYGAEVSFLLGALLALRAAR